MSRHLKIWVALLTLSLALPALSWSQAAPSAGGGNAPPPPSANKPPQPQTDQTTNIAYFTLRDGMNSTLTLNNLAPTQTSVTVTLFNTEGRAQVLDPITLDPHSFKQIELREVVNSELFDSGNIQVAFHGTSMAVTCQVSVYSLEKRISFESREQDMMDFESTNLNGILSLPQKDARGFLAVTNVSKNKVTVKLTVAPKTKEVELYPRETHLVQIDEEFGLHAPATALVKLSQNGLPGDVITTAFVMDLKDGYSSAFAMTDPKIMRSSHLAGAHFRFGQPDPSEGFPDGTRFSSPLLLANVSDKPVTAHVSVDYTVQEKLAMTPIDPKQGNTQDRFSTVAVKDLTIAPGDLQRIELAGELAKLGVPTPVKGTGVDIDYEAPPGSVIGHLVSVDQTGDYSFEVPIKDPAAMNEMMEGAYPWTLEKGADTVLHLKNTTDKSVVGLVVFTFPGGTYNPDRIHLEPYQTVAIDIQKLKDSKKLDVRQKLFPADAMHGQVVWRQETPYSMIGRAEEVDSKAGIARSFSCEVDCCFYWSEDFYLDPGNFAGAVGGTQTMTGNKEGMDCSGYNFGPYAVSANSWYSDNTSVTTISSGLASLAGAGQTNVWGVFSQFNYAYSGGYCLGSYTDYPTSSAALGFTRIQHQYPRNPLPYICRITSFFDAVRNSKAHHAEDVVKNGGGTSYGDAVTAMESGHVVQAVSGNGPASQSYPACAGTNAPVNYVKIHTSDGYDTVYAHVNPSVSVGQDVNAGDQIGTLDNSGCQSGPHLHVARKDSSGNPVNFTIPCVNPTPTTSFDDGDVLDDISDTL